MAFKKRTTSFQNRALMLLAPLSVALLLLLAVTSMVKAGSQAAPAASDHSSRLVVLLTTGLEDVRQPGMALRYALAAKQSGRFSEVVLLADGRGAEVWSGQLAELARQASKAGVRLMSSKEGAKQAGVPVEIVPDGAVKIAELIGRHYEVIHF